MSDPAAEPSPRPDPVHRHSRREAIVILLAWAVAFAWTVGYCTTRGYAIEGEVQITFGMPTWIFWGVLTPWAAAGVFSIVYSLFFIADDELGEAEDAHEGESPDDMAEGAGDE